MENHQYILIVKDSKIKRYTVRKECFRQKAEDLALQYFVNFLERTKFRIFSYKVSLKRSRAWLKDFPQSNEKACQNHKVISYLCKSIREKEWEGEGEQKREQREKERENEWMNEWMNYLRKNCRLMSCLGEWISARLTSFMKILYLQKHIQLRRKVRI